MNLEEFKLALLLEAAKEPASFIIQQIKRINFPNQYVNWLAVKLTKEFKEELITDFAIGSPELVPYIYKQETPKNKLLDLEKLKEAKETFITYWEGIHDGLLGVNDWIISSHENEAYSFKRALTRFRKLDQLSMKEAILWAEEWHKNLGKDVAEKDIVEKNEIVKVYDKYYWVNLKSNECKVRTDAVGCGRDSKADTIYTLKNKNNKMPAVSVSVKFSKIFNTYLQAKAAYKGKVNLKPLPEHFPYIEDLFKILNINRYDGSKSYQPQNDFKPVDIKDLVVLNNFKEAEEKNKARIKRLLGDMDVEDSEGIEIEDDELTVTINVDNGYIDDFVHVATSYEDPNYSIKEVLTGETEETVETMTHSFNDAWEMIEEQAKDPGF